MLVHFFNSTERQIMKDLWSLVLTLCFIVIFSCAPLEVKSDEVVKYVRHLAPDLHRCGICPHYIRKVCAFDRKTNSTFIFDNHCIMDLYNCIEHTYFQTQHYESCLYFGNFAYVHGYKYEDLDYDEDHIVVKNSKKNTDFIID